MSADRVQAPFGRRAAPILSRERVGAYTVLRCSDPEGPLPDPGQFYMLASDRRWGGGADERPFLPRACSVLRARRSEGAVELEFLLEAVGPGTARLCELGAGGALAIVGPLGNGFPPPAPAAPPLLVGGGVGIAPLAILQDRLADPGRPLLGFRDAAHAAGGGLLQDARIATDDGSVGHRGLVTELLGEELNRDPAVTVHACGPPPMLEAVRVLCAERRVPAQLALESGMACGYGACFGCVVPTREGLIRLCLDGPVLDAALLETALTAGAGH